MKAEKKEAEGDFLDVADAARILKVGEGTILELFRQWRDSLGKTGIPHVVVGVKCARTTREDIRRWYEAKKKLMGRMSA